MCLLEYWWKSVWVPALRHWHSEMLQCEYISALYVAKHQFCSTQLNIYWHTLECVEICRELRDLLEKLFVLFTINNNILLSKLGLQWTVCIVNIELEYIDDRTKPRRLCVLYINAIWNVVLDLYYVALFVLKTNAIF